MNIRKKHIVDTALENLRQTADVTGYWEETAKFTACTESNCDGVITFRFNDLSLAFNAEIMQEPRYHQLEILWKKSVALKPLIIIARHIFPEIKKGLRAQGVAYLEMNGNIFLRQQGACLWIDTQKPLKHEKEAMVGRAFTKTGLKVVFNFIIDKGAIGRTHREIALTAGVGLGNINYIINGLKEKGFVVAAGRNKPPLLRKKELLPVWAERYAEKLKPGLLIGTFRFPNHEDFHNWKNLVLKNRETVWGGEAAAALVTNDINHAILTIYTEESKRDIMLNYRLIPDPQGNVAVYEKFWKAAIHEHQTAPPELIYADLINSTDSRNIEAATRILNEIIEF